MSLVARRSARSSVACLLPWVLTGMIGSVSAHEVHEEVSRAQATVVRLTYADGEPFSFERYELFADGSTQPTLSGSTDGQGRAVFLPDQVKRWRVRAFSADGHGVDVNFETSGEAAISVPGPSTDRTSRVLLGVLVILALFCALQLFVRGRRPRGAVARDGSDAHP